MEVEEEFAKISLELNDKKCLLERELLEKVDVQNNSQSLKEELSFRESVYKKNKFLESRIKDLEAMLKQEREWNAPALEDKDQELKNLRNNVETQLQEYQELLNIKVALDMEIAAYRKLLEVEENRLHITPTTALDGLDPTTVQHDISVCKTPIQSAKRKRTCHDSESQIESSNHILISHSSKGDIEIEDHDVDGKFIKLHNKGNNKIPLGGWQLIRKAGEQETTCQFHRSAVFEPGAYITVWSSNAGVISNPPTDYVMKIQNWPIADTISSVLLNNNKEEMAVRETSKKTHHSHEERVFDSTF